MPIRFTIYQPMISASGDAERRAFKLLHGKSGKRWVVAAQSNAADNIYVDGGPGSKGMAGRTLTFRLENGETVDLQGPWKTGADGLYKDTGFDARETYTSQGIIARHIVHGVDLRRPDFYVGVLHHDEAARIGAFDRIEKMAQRFANEIGEPVHFAVVTHGGGHAGKTEPETQKDQAA